MGTPQRFGDNKENCVCKCEEGYMGRFQKRGGMIDCDINAFSVLNFQSDCIDMDDSYMIKCFQIASTICKPYSMTWRYECVRTCMALRGQSCIEEKYQRFCSHDPECPAMCNAMISDYCQGQAMQLVKTPQQKKVEEIEENQVIEGGVPEADEEEDDSGFEKLFSSTRDIFINGGDNVPPHPHQRNLPQNASFETLPNLLSILHSLSDTRVHVVAHTVVENGEECRRARVEKTRCSSALYLSLLQTCMISPVLMTYAPSMGSTSYQLSCCG